MLIKSLGEIKSNDDFDFICYIVGTGNLEPLIKLSQINGVEEKIVFTGSKYGTEIQSYFLKSNLFVHPGGIGLSLLHAMSGIT